jgi:hypothetical protein
MTQTLVAVPISKLPCLFLFDHQLTPEEASGGIFFYSIGSGQGIADPFLAFLRRIFWPNNNPNLSDGIFAILWTLKHAIETIPGNVSDPKQIVVLEKREDWNVRELSEVELQEHYLAINDAENTLREFKTDVGGVKEENDIDLPKPPQK